MHGFVEYGASHCQHTWRGKMVGEVRGGVGVYSNVTMGP
jgi:hypothetical protein